MDFTSSGELVPESVQKNIVPEAKLPERDNGAAEILDTFIHPVAQWLQNTKGPSGVVEDVFTSTAKGNPKKQLRPLEISKFLLNISKGANYITGGAEPFPDVATDDLSSRLGFALGAVANPMGMPTGGLPNIVLKEAGAVNTALSSVAKASPEVARKALKAGEELLANGGRFAAIATYPIQAFGERVVDALAVTAQRGGRRLIDFFGRFADMSREDVDVLITTPKKVLGYMQREAKPAGVNPLLTKAPAEATTEISLPYIYEGKLKQLNARQDEALAVAQEKLPEFVTELGAKDATTLLTKAGMPDKLAAKVADNPTPFLTPPKPQEGSVLAQDTVDALVAEKKRANERYIAQVTPILKDQTKYDISKPMAAFTDEFNAMVGPYRKGGPGGTSGRRILEMLQNGEAIPEELLEEAEVLRKMVAQQQKAVVSKVVKEGMNPQQVDEAARALMEEGTTLKRIVDQELGRAPVVRAIKSAKNKAITSKKEKSAEDFVALIEKAHAQAQPKAQEVISQLLEKRGLGIENGKVMAITPAEASVLNTEALAAKVDTVYAESTQKAGAVIESLLSNRGLALKEGQIVSKAGTAGPVQLTAYEIDNMRKAINEEIFAKNIVGDVATTLRTFSKNLKEVLPEGYREAADTYKTTKTAIEGVIGRESNGMEYDPNTYRNFRDRVFGFDPNKQGNLEDVLDPLRNIPKLSPLADRLEVFSVANRYRGKVQNAIAGETLDWENVINVGNAAQKFRAPGSIKGNVLQTAANLAGDDFVKDAQYILAAKSASPTITKPGLMSKVGRFGVAYASMVNNANVYMMKEGPKVAKQVYSAVAPVKEIQAAKILASPIFNQ